MTVSIMLISIAITGFIGTVIVGARAGTRIENQDFSLLTARSQAEFVASKPVASTFDLYGLFPSVPSDLTVTGDVTNDCQQRDYLQCVNIRVSRDQKETAVLDAFKAERFLNDDTLLAPNEIDKVPKSGGLKRVKTVTVPTISPSEGFAVVISDLFPLIIPMDILVRWEMVPSTTDLNLRTLIIYGGKPFGSQTEGITIATGDVPAPILAKGRMQLNSVLSVAARDITTGDYTLYFFNVSDDVNLVSKSAEISCVCKVES